MYGNTKIKEKYKVIGEYRESRDISYRRYGKTVQKRHLFSIVECEHGISHGSSSNDSNDGPDPGIPCDH